MIVLAKSDLTRRNSRPPMPSDLQCTTQVRCPPRNDALIEIQILTTLRGRRALRFTAASLARLWADLWRRPGKTGVKRKIIKTVYRLSTSVGCGRKFLKAFSFTEVGFEGIEGRKESASQPIRFFGEEGRHKKLPRSTGCETTSTEGGFVSGRSSAISTLELPTLELTVYFDK